MSSSRASTKGWLAAAAALAAALAAAAAATPAAAMVRAAAAATAQAAAWETSGRHLLGSLRTRWRRHSCTMPNVSLMRWRSTLVRSCGSCPPPPPPPAATALAVLAPAPSHPPPTFSLVSSFAGPHPSARPLHAGTEEGGAGAQGVRLMTMHAAKGLEFEAVFIPGALVQQRGGGGGQGTTRDAALQVQPA